MQPCREFQIRNQNKGVSEVRVCSSIFCDCSFDKLRNSTALEFGQVFCNGTLILRKNNLPAMSLPVSLLLVSFFQSRHQNCMTSSPRRTVVTSFQIFSALAAVSAQSSSMNPLIYNGCFTSSQEMKDLGPYVYQTPDYCQQQCINRNMSLMATSRRSHCWCGNSISESSGLVFDTECSSICTGYNIGSCR